MDDRELQKESRARRRKFTNGLSAIVLGGAMTGIGFLMGLSRTGDEATGWGVLAGVGFPVVLLGLFMAWLSRPGAPDRGEREGTTKSDRLQAQRVWQLWMFPLASIAFLANSMRSMQHITTGQGDFADYMGAALPVIYAWIVASITMGWDYLSRSQRRFMEDELTGVVRARAISAAFVVLMVGTTVAFGIGLWRTELSLAILPLVLTAAGVTAGLRFAWLDREFSKDG